MHDRLSLALLTLDTRIEDWNLYGHFLQPTGAYPCQLIRGSTLSEAIQRLQQAVPDILLLDGHNSGTQGLELLHQIRSTIPSTRMAIVILANQHDLTSAIQAMKAGAQDYLLRDTLTPENLDRAIAEVGQQLTHTRHLVEWYQPQQQLIAGIALRIRQSLRLEEILSTTTDEVRQFLSTDRVLVYQFHPDMSGTIVAESVLSPWTVSLGSQVKDTYFQQEGATAYLQGRKQIVEDVEQAGLTECHLQFLQALEVKAILVVPILVNNQLWGLLVAHHCTAPRKWQSEEVNLLETLAVQIAIAIQQASAYEQARTELQERIQIEKDLRESEERFRNTFEQAAVGIAHLSSDGHFIRLNQHFCEITGYTARELQALTLQEITHPDDLITDLKQMRNLLIGKIQTFSVEKRCIRKNRLLVWINLTLSLVRDQVGEPKYFIAVIEDMTARKQAEADRLEAEKVRLELKLLDTILDTILAGYWDADIPNHQQYISPGFKRMFGYEEDELANSPDTWKQLVFPEDLPRALANFERHVESHGQIPYYNELRYRHKNGSMVWVMCSGRVIAWDAAGNPLRMIGCHIDITKLKQAEEAVTKYAWEVQDLYNNAPCGYHSLDSEGNFININDTELQWLGYRREEMLGQPFTRFITEAGIQKFQQIYPLFQQRGWVKDLEFDMVCKDNTLFPVLISATAVQNVDGSYSHSRSTLFDIRDRKQAETQLRQINQQLAQTNGELARATQMKDEFLANMSHELRTPLNAILGMSECLLEEIQGPLNEQQRRSIATVERSGQHLLGLISDILDLSKIEAGKLELDLSQVSVAHLCQSSLSFVRQQALKKQIQLNLALASNLKDAVLDERRIRQVLINLLTNAVKFTPTGGKVTLEVHYEPLEVNLAERITVVRPATEDDLSLDGHLQKRACYLCISVVDTGIGISPADQAKLFQPFVQIDSALNRQYAGTGLGLVLVKRIIELHGGDISLQSIPREGSCFTVRLPHNQLDPKTTMAASPEPQPVPWSEPRSFSEISPGMEAIESPLILLAEDNEANINTISNYLKAKGYRIQVASNGAEAISLIQQHPDLVIMDIQMPGVDGITAIQRIRQNPEYHSIPIIALTALAMKGDREQCLEAGASDYLAKPVRLKQLAATIQHLLQNSL